MRRTIIMLAILFALASAGAGLAQNPTGTLTGHVTDGPGPLPGVTITLTSPSLQGTRSAVTEVSGDYLFRFLPPGEYRARFELAGFQTLDATVKVSAAQTARLDATMPQAKVAEEITVTGNLDTISSSATASSTLGSKLLTSLPVQTRDVVNYVALSPGITQTGPGQNISIAGSPSYESLYTVNGVTVTENVRGQVVPLYIEDAIEETTTSLSNVSAEYGRFTGGMVNAITKSGGNSFHGSFRTNMTSQKWTAPTPKTTNRSDTLENSYEATLGGFLMRDKLWFFAAGRTAKQSDPTLTTSTHLTDIPIDTTIDEKRFEGKLTFAPVPDHRFIGSYTKRDRTWAGYYFRYYPVYDEASVVKTRSIPEGIQAFNYTGVWSNNFFVEGQYSARRLTFKGAGSSDTSLLGGTPVWDNSTGAIYNSPFFCGTCTAGEEKRDNQEWLVKGSWFLNTAKSGSHDIRFGYDTYADKMYSNNWQSGSSYFVDADAVNIVGTGRSAKFYPVITGGTSYIEYWPIFNFTRGNDFKTDSAFVNDAWRFSNNLTFNLGLRFDKNDGTDGSGAKVVKDSKWSPRLAATWDPKADGDLQFTIGYGRYVAAIANTQADQSGAGSPAYYNIIYGGPDINVNGNELETRAALDLVFKWLESIGGILKNKDQWGPYSPNVPGYQTFLSPDIKSPSVDEITFSVSKRLGNKGLARFDYINRKWADFYSTRVDMTTGKVTDPNGIVYDKNVVESDNSLLKRSYNGFLFQGQYRVSDAFTTGGNYTWSRTEGNFDGENGGSGSLPAAVRQYPEYLDMKWFAPNGPLLSDQTHRAVLWGNYQLIDSRNHALNVSLMQRYMSGAAYDAFSTHTEVGAYVTNPGYETPPDFTTYYFSKRGEYRTEALISTDLSLNYSFKVPTFGSQVELFVIPQVTNVFNRVAVINPDVTVWTSYNKSYLKPFNPFKDTPKECPQGASSQTCRDMNANWQKGSNFGKGINANSYQRPRTFTVAVGVRF